MLFRRDTACENVFSVRRRLGEILIDEGSITLDQLEAALRAQIIYGGRVGTNLVESGSLTLEQLALALSKQYGVPAVLQTDFDSVKPPTLSLLPAKLVEKHSAVPLLVSDRIPKTISVGFVDPSRVEAIDEISFVTGMRVRPMVAPELRIFFYLEKFYGIRRRTRFIRVEGEAPPEARSKNLANHARLSELSQDSSPQDALPTTLAVEIEVPLQHLKGGQTPLPRLPRAEIREVEPVQQARPKPRLSPDLEAFLSEVNLDQRPAPPEPKPRPPVRSTFSLAESPLVAIAQPPPAEEDLEETILDLLPSDEEQAGSPAIPVGPPLSLAEALAKMSESESRNGIGDAIVDCLKDKFSCTVLFVVRHGVAFGWKGHGISDAAAMSSLAIPLNFPSFLKVAHDHRSLFRGPPPMDGITVHTGLWQLLKVDAPSEVLVAPITLRDRVVSLVVVLPRAGETVPDDAMATLTTLAFSASTHFVRLIQRAKTAA